MNDDELVDDEHRKRALAKLRLELEKDTSRAESIAAKCGLWELLRLCYLLRVSRSYAMNPRLQGTFKKAQTIEFHLHDDAAKYAIGLVAKNGSWITASDPHEPTKRFNNNLVEELMRVARHINSKFDTEKLLHIATVKVTGERDQEATLDMNLEKLEPKRKIYLYYGLRIEHFTVRSKEHPQSIPELVKQVQKDVNGLEEQFSDQFGLTIDRYCEGLYELKTVFEAKCHAALDLIDPQNTGSINFDQAKSFVNLARAMYFTDSELDAAVNADFAAYLRSHPFEPGSTQGDELRFHYLTRRPFLVGHGFLVLSPDLCFDSIVDNTRFTLLEGAESKHAYKAAASAKFLDEVAEIAKLYGYVEVERDVDLKQGKKALGDIDLVLFNASTNHTLLIEGKNHALPLSVYFCSPEAIDDHVTRNRDWERKVKGRVAHLKSDSSSYQMRDDWDYIVVSRMPEPLAHHTDLFVLCLEEFEQWISHKPRDSSFEDFYQRMYLPNKPTMTMEEMKDLEAKGYSLLRTEP